MSKIRTLVGHDDEQVRKNIVESISKLDYVEVVATGKDGIDTYNKIVDYKPEMVFAEYNFNNMNGIELMEKSKEKLQNDLPIFNIIVDKITENELNKAVEITNYKINALIRQPYEDRVIEILEEYKESKIKL